MADETKPTDPFAAFFDMQGEAMRELWGQFAAPAGQSAAPQVLKDLGDVGAWGETARKMQGMWLEFMGEKARDASAAPAMLDPAHFMLMSQGWAKAAQDGMAMQARLVEDSMKLWQDVLGGTMAGGDNQPDLPRTDRRFVDPAWRSHPAFALIHQTYLMLAEYFVAAAGKIEGVDPEKKEQMTFATKMALEAMSPDNFLATNPVVLQRTIDTKGANLVRGLQHLINDLRRGQLTHTDADAFKLGENIATTPGKVVHEGPLYQLIQYSPSTDTVGETPLVIFPPWINRFYILDLTPKKSFIKWAVDQGITVFVTSWKSADASMKDVVWDDYIRAEIEAI
ncbi:MAG: class I poly(R)-hydroxyalkanoic acid synthase, partial [Tsuneonella sp.]